MKNQIFKIILIGDVGTGKTTFLTQLIHHVAQRLPKPTTNLGVFTMRISKPPSILQIWDTPGDSKYFSQILGQISKFDAILIFIDVTNEYTYERARIVSQQLTMHASHVKNIAIHVVENKIETVQKDIFKRKVSKEMLHKITDKLKGGIFQYRQNQSVQSIIKDVLQWKYKSSQLLRIQKQKQDQISPYKQIVFEKQIENTNCQCLIS